MTALIDADSLVYIIASNFKETLDRQDFGLVREVEKSCKSLLDSICTFTHADSYLGSFSSDKNFRHRNYLYSKYKGNRPPKPEWYECWAPVIKECYTEDHGFIVPVDLEADDIVSALSFLPDMIVCSIDKDMKQVIGTHYNYSSEGNSISTITPEAATYNLWLQVLTGDRGDNIAGIPGLGDVKARKVLEIDNPILFRTTVINQFVRYFGEYYGPVIFRQTLDAIELMNPAHAYYGTYKEQLEQISGKICKYNIEQAPVFS